MFFINGLKNIIGKGSQLVSMELSINKEKVLSIKQERSYSEEEVMDMFHNLSMHLPLHYEFLVKEQFKKK